MAANRMRVLRVLSAAVLMSGMVLVGSSNAGAARPNLDVNLSGSGTGHVSSEFGGYRGVNIVNVTGELTPGSPITGTVQSDFTFDPANAGGAPGAPNTFVIALEGGTIVGHTQSVELRGGSPAGGPVWGPIVIEGGTGRFSRVTGGLLAESFFQSWVLPAPNYPFGDVTLSNFTLSGTLTF
jgi:hypothetical protein